MSTSSRSTPSTLEWRESAAAQNSEIWEKRTGDQKAEVVQNSEKISEFSQLSFCKERVLPPKVRLFWGENFVSRFWNAKLERVLARDTSSGCVTVMAGVQAVAALADDEHDHYEADDCSSALSDEHFRL